MNDGWDVDAAQTLLDEFSRRVPPRPERPPTFMEITRYPHYENVCSNILAFFLDPGNPHGLGTLFLDALVRAGGIGEQGREIGINIQISREESTCEGNRIDILIRSESHAIVIENKIFHEIGNPFEDYIKHVETHYKHLKPHMFLLTLKPHGAAEVTRFKNITYGQLINAIRALLGDHVANADTRYLTFMLDFLNTLDVLLEGRIMNEELATFLRKDDNLTKAKHFFKEIDTFKNELRKKISALEIEVKHLVGGRCVRQVKWREPHGLCDNFNHHFDYSSFDDIIVFNTKIDPKGWRFEIFLRNEPEPPDDSKLEKLRRLLHELGIKFEDKHRIYLQSPLCYTEEISKVAAFVQCIVDKLNPDSDNAEKTTRVVSESQ